MSVKNKQSDVQDAEFALGRQNYVFILIGCIIILLGFVLMVGGGAKDPSTFNANELFSFRRITLAPIIVVLGFVSIIYAIMKR